MSKRGFLLDHSHDIKLVNNDLAFAEGADYVKQKIKQRLLMFKNEWFLDADAGIPYLQDVFIKDVDLSKIEALYIRAIQQIPEIAEITSFEINLDNKTRALNVYFEVKDRENNTIEINL